MTADEFVAILDQVVRGNGQMGMSITFDGEWSILTVFGEEAPGSPMAAGSHVGAGDSLQEAIDEAFSCELRPRR